MKFTHDPANGAGVKRIVRRPPSRRGLVRTKQCRLAVAVIAVNPACADKPGEGRADVQAALHRFQLEHHLVFSRRSVVSEVLQYLVSRSRPLSLFASNPVGHSGACPGVDLGGSPTDDSGRQHDVNPRVFG